MLIGFDGSRIAKQFLTGTEHYSIEILKALSKIDYKNQYLIYSPQPISHKIGKLPKNFSYKIIPFPRLWTQFRLSWEILVAKPKPDVLFIPSHTIPLIHPQKTMVTVHDLGFKYFPQLYGKLEMKYQDFGLKMAIKKSTHIITVSQNTKKDLVKICRVDAGKITVIYHGYNQKLYKPLGKEEIRKKEELKEKSIFPSQILRYSPYIFFVGRIEEKKNAIGLLKAYAFLRREPKIKHKLVLAGNPGFGYDKYTQYKNSLPDNIKRDVIELGYTEDRKLATWMRNADLFFFPSLFEGFGLPVLEAMACGVPVVASKITSIPEVAGSAAILINPHKPYEMAVALSKVINDKKLRYSLVSKGKARASIFSWQKSAEKTLKVLEEVGRDKI